MSGQHRDPISPADEYRADLTRPPAPAEGQLAYESTITAPTEWVPYVYTEAEVRGVDVRRRRSIASLVCGLAGLLVGVIGVWGMPLSLAAVLLAVVAWHTERRARSISVYGVVTGLVGLVIGVGWIIFVTQVAIPRL